MNSFALNLGFEDHATDDVIAKMTPPLAEHGLELMRLAFEPNSPHGRHGTCDIGLNLQKELGDLVLINSASRRMAGSVDLKIERKTSRNIFFETHSNMTTQPGRFNPGWGVTLKANSLWWVFTDSEVLASISLPALRAWLDERCQKNGVSTPRLFTYPERVQGQHAQKNVTVGRLIPFREMPASVLRAAYRLSDGRAVQIGREEFLQMTGHQGPQLKTV